MIAPKSVNVVSHLLFDVPLIELNENDRIEIGGFIVNAFVVEYHSANALGYAIQDETGFRVVVSADTCRGRSLERQVDEVDVAAVEATYDDHYTDLASKHGHMTRYQVIDLWRKSEEKYSNSDKSGIQEIPMRVKVDDKGAKLTSSTVYRDGQRETYSKCRLNMKWEF